MACVDRVRQFLSPQSRFLRALLLIVFSVAPAFLVAQTTAPPIPVSQQTAPFDRVEETRAYDVPAHVAVVDGRATIEREGLREDLDEGVPLLAGDRIRTERGRVEVLFDDGSVIDMDHLSGLDFMSDSLVRLTSGRIRLAIARVSNAPDYRVDGAGVSAWIQGAGEYRVAIRSDRPGGAELELTVFRGQGELETPLGRTRVRAGQQAFAVATAAPSIAQLANASVVDDFDQWVEDQRDARLGVSSARYLPNEVRSYAGTFDQYGTWDYMADQGYVWYPTVDVGWSPYSHGRWSFYTSFGWTWIGGGRRWVYPTHHYGRWGLHANRWYWIPGRHWGPAWVSWGYAPNYVSWCPLGYNGYPVVPISYVNAYNVHPWRAWNVVPSRTFVHNVRVSNHVIRSGWTAGNWSQFTTRTAAPVTPLNTGRRAAPLRSPSTLGHAVPRQGFVAASPSAANNREIAPRYTRPGVSATSPSRSAIDTTSAPSRPGVSPSVSADPSRQRLAPSSPTQPSRSRAVTGARDVRPSVETMPPPTPQVRSRVPSTTNPDPEPRERTFPSRTIDPDRGRSRDVMPSRSSTPEPTEPPSGSARPRSYVAPPPSSAPSWGPRESSRPSRVGPPSGGDAPSRSAPSHAQPRSGAQPRSSPSSPPPATSSQPSRSPSGGSSGGASGSRTGSGSAPPSGGQAVRRGGR